LRTLAYTAAATALLLGAPAALAHQGSPNFLSQVNAVTPAVSGVDVTVLSRDDRLLLHNTSGKTVLVEGYENEPYARIDADGTVSVNTDSQAYYLNEERDGKVEVPPTADSEGEPKWRQISRSGRFEWHDHRMHWMAESDPEQVKDKDVRTKIFDWNVPVEVDGQAGAIAGTLFWTPVDSSGLPLPAIFAFAALVILLCVAIVIVRRRRGTPTPPPPSEPAREAW
jgi:hypothetical protein